MASHIGKLPVTIPAGVEVKIDGQSFTAKGAKGTDSYEIPEGITAVVVATKLSSPRLMTCVRPVQSTAWLAPSWRAWSRACTRVMPRLWRSSVPVTAPR